MTISHTAKKNCYRMAETMKTAIFWDVTLQTEDVSDNPVTSTMTVDLPCRWKQQYTPKPHSSFCYWYVPMSSFYHHIARVFWQFRALTRESAKYWQWSLTLVGCTLITWQSVPHCNKIAPANLFDFSSSTN